jgi:hypothetical protein
MFLQLPLSQLPTALLVTDLLSFAANLDKIQQRGEESWKL